MPQPHIVFSSQLPGLPAYDSKAPGVKHQALSTYEKELLALVAAVQKWQHYLQSGRFLIQTDHESLKHLLSQRFTHNLQQKSLCKLFGLDYEIQYKKGKVFRQRMHCPEGQNWKLLR